MRWVIDNQGVIRDVWRYAQEHGFRASTAEQIYEVVRSKGCVWVERRAGWCDVRLDPNRISRRAEAGIYLLLAEEVRAGRIVVSFALERTQHGIYPCATAAIAAIASELAIRRRGYHARFASRPMSARSLGHPDSEPLQLLLKAYRSRKGLVDIGAVKRILRKGFRDRFLVVERVDGAEPFVIRSLGSGYKTLDKGWTGLALDDQPDIDYGIWLARGYLAAITDNAPSSEDVDCIIYRPKYGLRRFGYRRLLLPFENRRRQFLLSASIMDPTVDLGLH